MVLGDRAKASRRIYPEIFGTRFERALIAGEREADAEFENESSQVPAGVAGYGQRRQIARLLEDLLRRIRLGNARVYVKVDCTTVPAAGVSHHVVYSDIVPPQNLPNLLDI